MRTEFTRLCSFLPIDLGSDQWQKRFRHPSSEAQTAGDEMVGEVMRKNSGAGGEVDVQQRCIYIHAYFLFIYLSIYLFIYLFMYLFIIYLFIHLFIFILLKKDEGGDKDEACKYSKVIT